MPTAHGTVFECSSTHPLEAAPFPFLLHVRTQNTLFSGGGGEVSVPLCLQTSSDMQELQTVLPPSSTVFLLCKFLPQCCWCAAPIDAPHAHACTHTAHAHTHAPPRREHAQQCRVALDTFGHSERSGLGCSALLCMHYRSSQRTVVGSMRSVQSSAAGSS